MAWRLWAVAGFGPGVVSGQEKIDTNGTSPPARPVTIAGWVTAASAMGGEGAAASVSPSAAAGPKRKKWGVEGIRGHRKTSEHT